jgi:hypothetical protein
MALFSGAGNGKMHSFLGRGSVLTLLNMGINAIFTPQAMGEVHLKAR